ncbi:MAG: hypothetical protein Q8P80_02815 [Candidatus Levybacteria bacterium]|nr:hypothetical protein [Candidatus Levybacteria bacterium]
MIDQILNIVNNPQAYLDDILKTGWVSDIKLIGGFLALIFGVLTIILIVKLKMVGKLVKNTGDFLSSNSFPKRHLNKSWQKVLLRLHKGDEANLRMALIEADNLFDDLLKQIGLPGESMADRLKNIDSSQIPNIDEIWRAHKLRNNIVHNHDYPVSKSEIEFGIHAYETALKELGYID